MRPVGACCFLLLCLTGLVWTDADAQWHSDSLTNTPVCVARFSQTHPDITSDGAGGAYIVWQDIRTTYGWDIYAQHLSANGERLWGPSGLPICTSNLDQYAPIIRADGYGGAFIIWSGGGDIYAQHVISDGTVSYATNGIPIGQSVREQRNPVMEVVKPGRAIVAFEDMRAVNSATRPDISLNILTSQGAEYGASGAEVISAAGGQRKPALIADQKGGALLAWESDYGLPVGVQASLLDSNGSLLWNGGGSAPGFTIFRGPSSENDVSNIALGLSGAKFLMAWEVRNISANIGQDIFANRVNRMGEKDWFAAIEVTGEWPSDQSDPTIVADDSNGFIIFFEDYAGDIPPRFLNRDLAAVRIRANGIDRIPAYYDGFFAISKQPRAQRYYRLVEADNRVYLAWDDARAGNDTAIYAQVVTKDLYRYFPTYGTSSSWGKPIAVRTDAQQEHVAMCKRTGGGVIIAWTDNRSGDQDIYAQVMFPDGSLPIELASFDVSAVGEQVMVEWKTAHENDHAGFEVERRSLHRANGFEVVASYKTQPALRGTGNTNYEKPYAFVDKPAPGVYEYRIADVSLDGTRTTHAPKQINTSFAAPLEWSLLPAYPNPASDKITLGASLGVDAVATLEVRNVLGQLLLTKDLNSYRGFQYFEIPTVEYANGSYLYQISAVKDGQTVWISPMQRFQVVR